MPPQIKQLTQPGSPEAVRKAAKSKLYELGDVARLGAQQYGGAIDFGKQAIQQAGQAGLQDIYGQAAQGLAAGQAASGRGGGSAYGGALQAGLGAGKAVASQRAGTAMQAADFGIKGLDAQQRALSTAGAQQLEALKYDEDKGSEQDVAQTKIFNELSPQVDKIIAEHKGYIWDSTDEMFTAIMDLASVESNQTAKEWLEKRARDIKSGDYDV